MLYENSTYKVSPNRFSNICEDILGVSIENKQFLTNWHERYNIEVFKLAINKDIPIIDITSKFLGIKNYSNLLCDDGIHPNEKGHKIIAEAIKEHIEKRKIKLIG